MNPLTVGFLRKVLAGLDEKDQVWLRVNSKANRIEVLDAQVIIEPNSPSNFRVVLTRDFQLEKV